jgi:hypothetical protein
VEIKANFDLNIKFTLDDLERMYRGAMQMVTSLKKGDSTLLMSITSEGGDKVIFFLNENEIKTVVSGDYEISTISNSLDMGQLTSLDNKHKKRRVKGGI